MIRRNRSATLVVALLALALLPACESCRDFAASMAESSEALQPFTLRGIDDAVEDGDLDPDTARALRDEARDQTRAARIAAGTAAR